MVERGSHRFPLEKSDWSAIDESDLSSGEEEALINFLGSSSARNQIETKSEVKLQKSMRSVHSH